MSLREPGQRPELELEFPPKPEYVRMVRLALGALARLHEADDEVVEDIKLAVSEACTRAVGANESADGDQPVVVSAVLDGRSLGIEVLDRGPTPAREVRGAPSLLDTQDLPFEETLALSVIRGLVDKVAVAPRVGGGSRTAMVVSLEGLGEGET